MYKFLCWYSLPVCVNLYLYFSLSAVVAVCICFENILICMFMCFLVFIYGNASMTWMSVYLLWCVHIHMCEYLPEGR